MSRNVKFDPKRYYVSGSGNWEFVCIYIIIVINITMVVILTVIVITFTISLYIVIWTKNWTFNNAIVKISSGLACFGFLNVMKAKSDAFYHLFCPGNIFSWDYDSFVQRLTPIYSEDGSNDKLKEVNVYRIFVDFV